MRTIVAGEIVGARYRIEDRIARGGMAWIVRGRHVELGTSVAIKVLDERHARDPIRREALLTEARLLARVQHEHVVEVLDAGVTRGGHGFVVMEYIVGVSLEQVLLSRGRLTLNEACRLGRQLACALGSVHEAGVVHRDVKTDNVLVFGKRNLREPRSTVVTQVAASRCKLVDFGIARLANGDPSSEKEGLVWGTPRFMAPEQAAGMRVGAPADVYALGLVLYDMLCGRLPFVSTDPRLVMRSHVRDRPPSLLHFNPRCPSSIADLVHRCLRKRPSARPTADDVAHSLTCFSEQVELDAVEPGHTNKSENAA